MQQTLAPKTRFNEFRQLLRDRQVKEVVVGAGEIRPAGRAEARLAAAGATG